MKYRIEKDTMGGIRVPADRYWGAQTQRSVINFPIGPPASMPVEIIHAFGYIKKAAAITNNKFGLLSDEKMKIISRVCDEISEGKLDDHFPLVIWQTGSGTHTNMNCNEVIANRSHVLLGNKLGTGERFIHPNDDVNKSQSSNDTFATAMNLAAYKKIVEYTIPDIERLSDTILTKSYATTGIVKIVGLPGKEISKIEVYTLDGKLVDRKISDATTDTIDLSRQSRGTYVLVINKQILKIIKE